MYIPHSKKKKKQVVGKFVAPWINVKDDMYSTFYTKNIILKVVGQFKDRMDKRTRWDEFIYIPRSKNT